MIPSHDPMPAAGAVVTLREVTADTVRTITALSVSSTQRDYVATNAESIAQAYFHPTAWFRAVFADEVPVGFVMIEDETMLPTAEQPAQPAVGLWRFMIDQRAQGRGFGSEAIELVVRHALTRPGIHQLWCSCVPGPHSPRGFYERLGFINTGRIDDGEDVLVLNIGPLRQAPATTPARARQ